MGFKAQGEISIQLLGDTHQAGHVFFRRDEHVVFFFFFVLF